MRRFIPLIIFLLSCKLSMAQKAVHAQAPLFPNSDTKALYSGIDNLNNRASDIYLTAPDSARVLAENALMLSQRANYGLGKARSFYNIGLVYWSQSYYTISLFYLNSAINNLSKHYPLQLSDCYNALGRTYADLGNYDEALQNLNRSLKLAGDDKGREADVYSERAYVYCALKKFDRAIAAANRALSLDESIKAEGNIAVLYARLGSIYKNKGDYKMALHYDSVALKKSFNPLNKRLQAKTYVEFAAIYNLLHNDKAAVALAQRGIALANTIGVASAWLDGYRELVNSYELAGNLKLALTFQKRYSVVNDSLHSQARLQTIKLIQNYYALNAKLNRIKQMEVTDGENKAKIKAQTKLILILSLSMVVLISVLFAIYYLYKQKKLLNKKLEDQHKALLDQKALIEVQTNNLQSVNGLKDKLLAVIGHDLRTPVANMSNIIEMFNDEYLTAAEVNDLMKEISPIIKGAELTLSNLTEWAGSQIKGRNVNRSNVDIFLLGVEMEQTFTHHLQTKKIEFSNKAFAGQSVLADENHIKVILRNLVSNAIKFTDSNGSITLATMIEDNGLIVSVTDTGKGMDRSEIDKLFSINTHFSHSGTSGERGTGIGLLLCKELVELNGGKLMVKSAVGKGSTFYFNLPLTKTYA
ncbi:MAG TPA: ATP-binding protein [Mucilaginibacter sp.]